MFANLFGKTYLAFHVVLVHISISISKDNYIYKIYVDTQIVFLFCILIFIVAPVSF